MKNFYELTKCFDFSTIESSCSISAADLEEDKTPYFELDSQPGLTPGDEILKVGDDIVVNTVFNLDECRKWSASLNFSLR